MAHTPKPWKVTLSSDRFGCGNYYINIGDKHSLEERRANARLIKAAPAMLDALECAIVALYNLREDQPSAKWINENGWMTSSALFSKANQAIAKAKENDDE